jgi:hypothetical protein
MRKKIKELKELMVASEYHPKTYIKNTKLKKGTVAFKFGTLFVI